MIRFESARVDPGAELARLGAGRADAGALASFLGQVRDEGGRLRAMTLEHYPGMAERRLAAIEAEARARWPLLDLLVVHRVGRLLPGEPIVLVGVLAAHRAAALAACAFVIDRLKTEAPFWKHEERADGGGGVEARPDDEARARLWEVG